VCKTSPNENLNMLFRSSVHFRRLTTYTDRIAYKLITFCDGCNVLFLNLNNMAHIFITVTEIQCHKKWRDRTM